MDPAFFEYSFKSVEYLTEDSWRWRWREFFLREVSNTAPHVLRELAELLPLWKENARGITTDSLAHLSDSNTKRFNEFFQLLYEWQKKYGLDADQKGHYPGWVWWVVNDTFHMWDKYTPNPAGIGRRFEIGGVEMKPLEEVMAHPRCLSGDPELAVVGPETEEEIQERLTTNEWLKQRQEECREAAAGVDLVLPPDGFPTWVPVMRTRKNYLKEVDCIVHKRIMNDPVLSQAESSARRAFIKAVLEPVNSYCQRLAKHYQENGYRKAPGLRTAEQQIAWTVQVQVLARRMSDVAQQTNSYLTRVQPRVHDVLRTIDLALRSEITPGRPRHSKNSPMAPHRKT